MAIVSDETNKANANESSILADPTEDAEIKQQLQSAEIVKPIVSSMHSNHLKLVLEFGGQSLSYWTELQMLFKVSSTARDFISHVSEVLYEESKELEARQTKVLISDFTLLDWLQDLEDDVNASRQWKWSDAVYSYPLITLTQLANYISFLDNANLDHGTMMTHSEYAIGHSQGIVSATVCAIARNNVELRAISVQFIRYMFWHGLRAQEAWNMYNLDASNTDATPMLAIVGLGKDQVLAAMKSINKKLRASCQLSLINGQKMFTVSGASKALAELKKNLDANLVHDGSEQVRIPYSDRKIVGKTAFLQVSCPFHSDLLASAKAKIMRDIERIDLRYCGHDVRIPVYDTTENPANLQESSLDVLENIVEMQLTKTADWTATWGKIMEKIITATHILDFGPGQGAAKLSKTYADYAGIKIVLASEKYATHSGAFTGMNMFLNTSISSKIKSQSWKDLYSPKVIANDAGKLVLVNKFTRLLKKPPVMIAGMTPTTSINGVNLVAASINSGYHAELAGGGLSRPNIFESTILELVSKIRPGCGISVNMLYLNAKQWGFQFPAILRLRRQGVPIESITIGAGVPSSDRATEIIQQLQSVRINLIAFKPGSTAAIYAVLDIARENPDMNVMLQWTGGRAGGHHSFEDFHSPLESTYSAIRRVKNVLLVVGSGFGDFQDSVQYINGDWALKRNHLFRMPADGILLGSRVMVAKEAATAKEVKQLLVDTPGIIDESDWDKSYKGVVGGIITVTSELGEPIHKVANRGTLCWHEFDEKFFSKPRDQLEALIRLEKEQIITRLNNDFQKPYFGCKSSENDLSNLSAGAIELNEMTYAEVLARMVDLMYVKVGIRPNRWIDPTYKSRFLQFVERFQQVFHRFKASSFEMDLEMLDTCPLDTVYKLLECYPQGFNTLMSVADVDFFLDICRSGGKPVNFIPILDSEFRTWFKKDSLWYSEDLDAVPNRDSQRVCILQGPVAVRYSTICDQPVASILDDITQGYTSIISAESVHCNSDSDSSRLVPKSICGLVVENLHDNVYQIAIPDISPLSELQDWFLVLQQFFHSTDSVASFLRSTDIVCGKHWTPNRARALVQPLPFQRYVIENDSIKIFQKDNLSPSVIVKGSSDKVLVQLFEIRPETALLPSAVIPLELVYSYNPMNAIEISEDEDAGIEKIKAFYAKFWVAENGNEELSCKKACEESVFSEFTCEYTITAQDVSSYKSAMGFQWEEDSVPTDFATLLCWKPLIQSVFTRQVKSNLLDLVHLKHSYSILNQTQQHHNASFMFKAGDETMSNCTVSSVRISDIGKSVSGKAIITKKIITENMVEEYVPVIELHSEFLVRGNFTDFSNTFSVTETKDTVKLSREEDIAILISKSWLKLSDSTLPRKLQKGDEICFDLKTREDYAENNALKNIAVSGKVSLICRDKTLECIGQIELTSSVVSINPIRAFIDKLGEISSTAIGVSKVANGGYFMLEEPLWIHVPKSADAYAVASRDLNPIHRSDHAAILANLPEGKPIMHGMWTATKVRSLIVEKLAANCDVNVLDYAVSFDGMVYPGDTLYMQARHIGQHDGNKVLSVKVVNESQLQVMSATAEIRPPLTAFIFTGQGSAEIGMGMDRYNESAAAREIWDRGERHLLRSFGFSILDIVRNNPKRMTIHFGGRNGRIIRQNYMKLRCDNPVTGESIPLLPEINQRTQSFTFSAPEGLLFATQFSQPALLLLEKAIFSEMQEAHLIGEDSSFAGHSLGEYAGLCAFANALEVEDVAEVVFLRGLIMQKAVVRDSDGHSDYGMVAANPSRVGADFTADMLSDIVDKIATSSSKLLQVVNYNVQHRQYVVAGDILNLEVLSVVLTKFAKSNEQLDVNLEIKQAAQQMQQRKEKCKSSNKPFHPTRGHATIPLVGIDVPFHSKELLTGVPSFRKLLKTKFNPHTLAKHIPSLVDHYIPNLVAKPFSLERSYVEEVYRVTSSPYLAEALDPSRWNLITPPELTCILLIELLAYQFASPVQWIKTQDLLFSLKGTGVRRLIEIGPSPTLTNMALRTLQSGQYADIEREILYYQRDRDVVHYELENEFMSAAEYVQSLHQQAENDTSEQEEPVTASVSSPTIEHTQIPIPRVQAMPAASIPDRPLTPELTAAVLIAFRCNKPLSGVKMEHSVKELCNGKSALQNEIMGDLDKEFAGAGTIPDGASEIPIKELTAKLSNYNKPGKVSQGLISRMLSSKLPGGFSVTNAKDFLSNKRGLCTGLIDSVFVFGITEAPSSRLKTEADARKWLERCVDKFAAYSGMSLAPPAAPSVGLGNAMHFGGQQVSVPTVTDKPLDVKHVLKILVGIKLNKKLDELPDTASIKELSAGKSALQNEIVGDLANEFGSGVDEAAELKLSELSAKISNYTSPGKLISAIIAKQFATKMPGGFNISAVKAHLTGERCLPAGRVESILVHSLLHAPKQRLADEGKAKAWLDNVVDDYAKYDAIDIPYRSRLQSSSASMMMPQMSGGQAISSDFEKRLTAMIAEQANVSNEFLGKDTLDWHRKIEAEHSIREQVESSLAVWTAEHGDEYGAGIRGKFDPKKERLYDSFWNWALQDAYELYYRTLGESVAELENASKNRALTHHFEEMSRWINTHADTIQKESSRPPLEWFRPFICNRVTPELIRCTQYFKARSQAESRSEYAEAIQLLAEQLQEWTQRDPVNVHIFASTAPQLTILNDGKLDYKEVPRQGVLDSTEYVKELARGLEYEIDYEDLCMDTAVRDATLESAVGMEAVIDNNSTSDGDQQPSEESEISSEDGREGMSSPELINGAFDKGEKLNALRDSLCKRSALLRKKSQTLIEQTSILKYGLDQNLKEMILPHVHIRRSSDIDPMIRLYDVGSTCMLLRCMHEMATKGVSFAGKIALLTGCGNNSIGAEILKSLLEGGATVVVTTSSYGLRTTKMFQSIYEQHGSRGSRLFVVPFNQASKADVQALIAHIYEKHKLDLDFIIPFAALPENGRMVTEIDGRSELAHRIMLTNTIRLIGQVANAKKIRGIITRPALVVLPMSPNHGNFGGDGLYAESKLGIESLLNKWYSETWRDQVSVVGAVIGWTRGTGLMSANNIVAEGVEKLGVRSFSTVEMGFNLCALLHPSIVDSAAESPLYADLTGGMAQIQNLKDLVDNVRAEIMHKSKIQSALSSAVNADLLTLKSMKRMVRAKEIEPRANLSHYYTQSFPSLDRIHEIATSSRDCQLLQGMIDLEKVVVVTGFGEASPWGNSRTRWEMESYGEFSLEGCIELAWLTGYIEYKNGQWIDVQTKESVPDHTIKAKYEQQIIEHAGIRIVEPELFEGYDPKHKYILHQIAIDKKMAPIEVSDLDEALLFRDELGEENIDIFQDDRGSWLIRLRKGAVLSIPRALKFDRFVAGQIPTGWSAERLGMPKDLAESVDPITLYTLASTADAFISAGVLDPYEFYQYVHVSEVGNSSGGGMGGMRAFKRIFQHRLLGRDAPSDTLQECFINTPPAWVNMLLLSSSGPIKTPVGACATAAESVDIGVETIKSGKARIVLVGGFDDFGEEGAFEFAQMKATSDNDLEIALGREPKEMCRPCSSTRGGFMESHGAGIQLLMDAKLALEMGCPIYGVIAMSNTATDKNGRSVPAPGQGILTSARELQSEGERKHSPLLDVSYRRRQFDAELESIQAWYVREKEIATEMELKLLNSMRDRKVKAAQEVWGTNFYHGRNDIAPLRGALCVWNLTIDDIGAVSFHGTGTQANDSNESEVTQKQMRHLGRSSGNPLPVICQKYLTGHPKGAAAAWMLNGLLQVINSGIIPGNRNLDNACNSLRKFDYLMYSNRSIKTNGVKAAMLKSFGFGQAGGEILVVHPDVLLSILPQDALAQYRQLRTRRQVQMNTHLQKAVTGKVKYFTVKDAAPYTPEQESQVYLDPTARASYEAEKNSWTFHNFGINSGQKSSTVNKKESRHATDISHAQSANSGVTEPPVSASKITGDLVATATQLGLTSSATGLGVDVEPIATFADLNDRQDFVERNFTRQEITYCNKAAHPAASYAGRWAAKEAVIKAISSAVPTQDNLWKGSGSPLHEIEICPTASGSPTVSLSGYPLKVFQRLGLGRLSVSISHSGEYAVAQAIVNYNS